jgi:DNA-binding NtrC family response regulator
MSTPDGHGLGTRDVADDRTDGRVSGVAVRGDWRKQVERSRSAHESPASSQRPISGRLYSDGEVPPLPVARREAAEAFELEYLKAILDRARGNVTRAAAIAKVSRQIVQKLLRKHNLRGTGP